MSKSYPIPHLPAEARAALDEECHRALGHDFEALVRRCRVADAEVQATGGAHGWRPASLPAIWALVEVAIGSTDSEGRSKAEQVFDLLDDAIYLQESDDWHFDDDSVLDIGEGYVEAK